MPLPPQPCGSEDRPVLSNGDDLYVWVGDFLTLMDLVLHQGESPPSDEEGAGGASPCGPVRTPTQIRWGRKENTHEDDS